MNPELDNFIEISVWFLIIKFVKPIDMPDGLVVMFDDTDVTNMWLFRERNAFPLKVDDDLQFLSVQRIGLPVVFCLLSWQVLVPGVAGLLPVAPPRTGHAIMISPPVGSHPDDKPTVSSCHPAATRLGTRARPVP